VAEVCSDGGVTSERAVRLTCHPAVDPGPVRAIEVVLRRSAAGMLVLRYRVSGDLALLRVPSPRAPRIADRLWEHTCFEAFVGLPAARSYHELNFSPSGEWAAFAFRDTRDGARLEDDALTPTIERRDADSELVLDASVSLVRLAQEYGEAPLRLGLSAVVETTAGDLSYWALRHAAPKPDFHHNEAFALRLDAA
jgi:hypothetical protein